VPSESLILPIDDSNHKEVSITTKPHDTHAENKPVLASIPGDALDAVARAGHVLEAAGDFKTAATLYRHFITTLRLHALAQIESLGRGKNTGKIASPAKELFDLLLVRANPARYSFA